MCEYFGGYQIIWNCFQEADSKMPMAPFGDDLWLTSGIQSMLRKLRLKLKILLAKTSARFTQRCISACFCSNVRANHDRSAARPRWLRALFYDRSQVDLPEADFLVNPPDYGDFYYLLAPLSYSRNQSYNSSPGYTDQ